MSLIRRNASARLLGILPARPASSTTLLLPSAAAKVTPPANAVEAAARERAERISLERRLALYEMQPLQSPAAGPSVLSRSLG